VTRILGRPAVRCNKKIAKNVLSPVFCAFIRKTTCERYFIGQKSNEFVISLRFISNKFSARQTRFSSASR